MSQFRLLQRHAARRRERDHSLARATRVRFFGELTGIGQIRAVGEEAVRFDTFFLEEPTFTYGITAMQPIPDGRLPLVTAVVLGYLLDDSQKMWIGAELGFRVDAPYTTTEEIKDVQVKFSLTFEGYALRSTAHLLER